MGSIDFFNMVTNHVERVKRAEASKLFFDILKLCLELNFSSNNSYKTVFNINWDLTIFVLGDVAWSLSNLLSELVVLAWEDKVRELGCV